MRFHVHLNTWRARRILIECIACRGSLQSSRATGRAAITVVKIMIMNGSRRDAARMGQTPRLPLAYLKMMTPQRHWQAASQRQRQRAAECQSTCCQFRTQAASAPAGRCELASRWHKRRRPSLRRNLNRRRPSLHNCSESPAACQSDRPPLRHLRYLNLHTGVRTEFQMISRERAMPIFPHGV